VTSIHSQEGRTVRRLVPIAAATVTAILLTAACATSEAAQNERSQGATPTLAGAAVVSSPPASPVAAEPAIAAPARTGLPTTFLAVRDDSRLVMADTATGRDQRVLFDLGPQDDTGEQQAINGLALSPDRRTAFFSVGPEPMHGVLYKVAVDGGPAERIGSGWRPAVSPDGRRLASMELDTVVVRDLATGAVRRLEPEEDNISDPMAVAWAADSRHLFVDAIWQQSLRVVDADTATNWADGPLLGPGPDHGEYWLTGVRATDGSVGALIALYPPQSDAAEPARTFVVLDPATGAETSRLDLPFAAWSSVYDATGRHQLFVAEDGSLHRHSWGGGFTTIPGAGATRVAW
jgi:hypothetical protein